MLELSVLLLGSEVCDNRRVTAGRYPRQINLPTAFHEKDIATIFPANTGSVNSFYRASAVAASPVLATIEMSVRLSVRLFVRHTLTLCENDAS